MLTDIADHPGERFRADVCVIGAGAAGLTIASELADGRATVVLLESGGLSMEPATQALYRSDVTGLPHGGIHSMRFRVFGGSTSRWAGQALPLARIDFEARSWVASSGWPIEREELNSYYARASRLLGVPSFAEVGDEERDWPIDYRPGFSDGLVPLVSRFSPHPRLADSIGARVITSRVVRVVLHANVTELVSDGGARAVELVRAQSLDGASIEVEAATVVVCAGGIDTPRLLLASNRHAAAGLGNDHDVVGRYFQDHPGLAIGPLHDVDRHRTRATFRPRRVQRVKYQPLFRASDEMQRAEHMVNVGGGVLYPQSDAVDAAKIVFRAIREREGYAEARGALALTARRPLPAIAAAWRHFVAHQPAIDTSGVPYLAVGGEQAPNPESRILLTEERDVLGMPRVALQWQLTKQEPVAWRRLAEAAATELERTGYGRIADRDLELPDDPDGYAGKIVDSGHHIGATRMADHPTRGVVDRDLRVFGLANLYVASSSVFPTGGFSNPTLTIMALAIRLSDRLRSAANA